MKLKDFMANTLPRAKKSKKKHTPPLNNALNNFSTTTTGSQAGNTTTQNKKETNVNQRPTPHPIQWSHSGSFVGGGSDGREWQRPGDSYTISTSITRSGGASVFQSAGYILGDTTNSNPNSNPSLALRPDHFCLNPHQHTTTPSYPDEKRTPIDSVNFNIQSPDQSRKCGCYKHIVASPCSSPESFSGTGSDGNFHTFPRCRTRIRTNPWLPSPRESPTPTLSSSSSVTSSPLTSPSVFSPDSTDPDSRRWLFPDPSVGNSGFFLDDDSSESSSSRDVSGTQRNTRNGFHDSGSLKRNSGGVRKARQQDNGCADERFDSSRTSSLDFLNHGSQQDKHFSRSHDFLPRFPPQDTSSPRGNHDDVIVIITDNNNFNNLDLSSPLSMSTEADSLLQTSFCSDVSTDNSITANVTVRNVIEPLLHSFKPEPNSSALNAGSITGSSRSQSHRSESESSHHPQQPQEEPFDYNPSSSSEDYYYSDDMSSENRRRKQERKSRKVRDSRSYVKSPDCFQPIEEEDFALNHPENSPIHSRYDTKYDLFREDASNDSDGTLRGDEAHDSDAFLFEDTKLFSDDEDGRETDLDLRSMIMSDVTTTTTTTDDDGIVMAGEKPTVGGRRAKSINRDSMDSAYDTAGSISEKGSSHLESSHLESSHSTSESPKESPSQVETEELTPGRKVNEIRSSLQEKVLRLREEKYVVDEKIRQAQEEERIRQQEKMKFQKQVTMLRKQILLRTLHDLKRKLDNQSQRLQSTYNSVMGLQWERARSRKRFASITPNLPRRNVIQHKESPF